MKLQGRTLTIFKQGDDVRLLHRELRQLGFVLPDDELRKALYGKGTREAVLKFQEMNGLKQTGDVDESTAQAINARVEAPQPQLFIVRGQVGQPDGSPLAGAIVRAYARDPGGENLLGETRADEDGHYAIRYTEDDFRRPEKEAGGPDLIIRVYSPEGQMLAQSEGKRNAGREETVNLTVGSEAAFSLSGTVSGSDGRPRADALVRAYDQDLGGENLLGEAQTDAAGHYAIRYTAADFRRSEKEAGGPDLIVRVYSPEGRVLAQSECKRNAGREETIDLTVGSEAAFSLSGTVSGSDGRPRAGVLVRVYDQDLRNAQLLGEAPTDAAGHYRIVYTSRQFLRAEKTSADLRAAGVDAEGKELAASGVLFSAPPEAVINLTLPPDGQTLSEFELLIETIQPLLAGQGQAGADLQMAELEEKDIAFLSQETGQPQGHLTCLLAAIRAALAADTSGGLPPVGSHVEDSPGSAIPVALFYGWFRQGLPTALAELLTQSEAGLREALVASLGANIIPAALGGALDSSLARLQQLAAERLLKPGEPDGQASLGDLLSTVLPDPQKQRTLASLFVSRQGPSAAFWEALKAAPDFSPGEIEQIQTTLQLGALTGNYLPLVRELQRLGQADPALNAARGLARLELADWENALRRPQADGRPVGVPADVPGETESAKITHYAQQLKQSVENTFPTAVIAHRIEKDDRGDGPFGQIKTDFQTFFANNPAFELGTTAVDLYLSQDRDKRLSGVKQPEALTLQLKNLQRVFKITPRFEQINALLADDLHSAQAIVQMGKQAFMEKHGQTFGGEEPARTAYTLAENITLQALMVYARYSVAFNLPAPYVIAGDLTKKMTPPGPKAANSPDLRTLFGSLDLCDCDQYRSLYSPAAYLVDSLKFLKDGPRKDGKTPLEILLQRRPDIADLELTCANTDTPVPYVDLVEEVLANSIAPLAPQAIPIPAGRTPVADLDGHSLPVELKNALALSGQAAVTTIQPGQEWGVDAAGCRWTVRYLPSPPQLVLSGNGLHHLVVPTADLAATLAALNSGQIPAEIQAPLSPRQPGAPADPTFAISPVQVGLQWQLTRSYQWTVTRQAETYTFDSSAGQMVQDFESSDAAELDQGSVPSDILTFLDGVNAQASVSTAQAKQEWQVTLQDRWNLRYQADSLNIISMALQTSGTPDELNANPEHSNPKAYAQLRQAVYPWSLPFNLGREEARTYLRHLGVRRSEVMELFYRGTPLATLMDADIAREYLDLSLEEAGIIAGTITGDPRPATPNPGAWNFWGLSQAGNDLPDPADGTAPHASGNWDTVLKRVSVFLQQSGLSYKELLELLGTQFINPVNSDGNRALSLVSTDPVDPATCNLSRLEISGLDIPTLEKIHRFVRLGRRLGWPKRDLDKALTALNVTDWTTDFLPRLSHLQRLRASLNVPLVTMLSWWSEIDTAVAIDQLADGQPRVLSLYDQLFRNKMVIQPLDEAFTEEPQALHGNLSDHLPALGAALGLNAADLALLLQGPLAVVPDDRLNLANLSSLYRVASFARALRLSVRDFLSIRELSGLDPFAAIPAAGPEPALPATAATLRFVETTGMIRASGFQINELAYLLQHRFTPADGIAPAEDALAARLAEIRGELQKIARENRLSAGADDPDGVPADSDGELTRKKLALLNWDTALIEQVRATFNDAVMYTVPLAQLSGSVLPNDTGRSEVALAALPAGFVFPAELNAAVTYDPNDTKLRASRRLNQAERARLKDLADGTGDQDLIRAVISLFDLQDELQGEITYDPATQQLRFTGAMTLARQARLKRASAEADYQAAVEALYNAPRTFVARNLRSFVVPDFATGLAELPAGVTFPKALQSQVYFDVTAEPKQLHFIGAMTELQRAALKQLSTDVSDPRHALYLAAVDDLFAQPDAFAPPAAEAFLTDAENNAAALFDQPLPPEERFRRVLKKLLPYLRQTLSERGVVQKLAAALQLEAQTAQALLLQWVNSPAQPAQKAITAFLDPAFGESSSNTPLTAAEFPDQFNVFTRLHKIALLVRKFKLTPGQLAWLFAYGPGAGWLDLNALPLAPTRSTPALWTGWERCGDLFRLRDQWPLGESGLTDVFSLARDGTATVEALQIKLSQAAGWRLNDLAGLAGAQGFDLTFPEAYRDERALVRLQAGIKLMKRLGASAAQLGEWSRLRQTPAAELEQARDLKNVVKAKYADTQWLAIAKPLKDSLREKQRAALAAYLMAHPDPARGQNWRDANGLYEHFLIDVEMDPCQLTTRLKQAINSVQLFVQRCLMNLEPAVSLTAEEAQEWRGWRKQYRVWEANRKVFLYPENWLEPELRDDKSPFFKDLENELLQNDVTLATAETAFWHYLEKLDEVTRLEIVGQCYEQEPADAAAHTPAIERWHIFGRTLNAPPAYFYRKLEQGEWTAWEKIELDIQGEHILPIVWNRRLLLFWLVFTEKALEKDEARHPGLKLVYKDGETPAKMWEIGIAWSERRGPTWLVKRLAGPSFVVKAGAMHWPPGQKYYVPPPPKRGVRFQREWLPDGKIGLQIHYTNSDFDDYTGNIKTLITTQQMDLDHGFKFSASTVTELVGYPPVPAPWFSREEVDKPEVNRLTATLNSAGIPGLLSLAEQTESFEFAADFRDYSLYVWELFFHAPFMIATRLSKNQRFAEAQKWFHYIFDPTASQSGGAERFWRVKPFQAEAQTGIQTLAELLRNVQALEKQIDKWKADPFKPYVIARLRRVAYMKAVVMKYIDNLIDWGDQLFRRDTLESINEATQLYILAAQILGGRPAEIPPRANPETQTFTSLTSGPADLNDFSNELVAIENFIFPSTASGQAASGGAAGLGTLWLFCVPPNDKLLGYWDTVADRLFKIRHCQNLEGVARQLPLFEPPIDPALLVRAAAAGVDLSSALNDINATLPYYRFNIMLPKAIDLCNDVRTLGGALLAALEKRDAEALALLRSGHELKLLDAVRQIKEQQIKEADHTLAGLKKYREVVMARRQYYLSRPFMNPFERVHTVLTANSLIALEAQVGAEVLAAIIHLIPDAKLGLPTTAGTTYGGSNIASGIQAFGGAAGTTASMLNTAASLSATLGGYQRRQEDWTHQADLATKELEQVKKQIVAAEIRVAIAERELQNHAMQIENAQEADAFMRAKYTHQELYEWMVGQLAGLYFQSYQLAYDMAKRAERAYRYELGLSDSNFVQFGYWDSLKKGLLAGEKLHSDLKRMDVAYLDQNKREYEIAKHISLAQIDPLALVSLKSTGACEIGLPELLFDMDYPGHYLRRLKSVSLTIPCVTGPYTGVNCTLTLLQSSIRQSPLPGSQYAREAGAADPRFADSFGALQSIVTSSAQNDSGLFEPNLRDERYLPFEGAGVISTWRLELPQDFNYFDLDTLADVVLHLRYTAREGGNNLREAAASFVRGAQPARGMQIFDLRRQFATAWQKFLQPAAENGDQALEIDLTNKDLFPFFVRNGTVKAAAFMLFAETDPENDDDYEVALEPLLPAESPLPLSRTGLYGPLHSAKYTAPEAAKPEVGRWTFKIKKQGAADFTALAAAEIKNLVLVISFVTERAAR